MKKLSKVDIILIVFTVIVMAFIFWWYTNSFIGKGIYEANRENAIKYISQMLSSSRYSAAKDDAAIKEEIFRLIKKYDLEGMFSIEMAGGNPIEEMIHENH